MKDNRFPTQKKIIRLTDIFPNNYNCNIQSEDMFQKEIESIKKFGFVQPILVRETDGIHEIIDGYHRWLACKELKFDEIPVECIGKISDATAKILTINLNNLRGQDDILKRAEILKTLSAGQLTLLPFDKDQIENEIKLLSFDFSQFNTDDTNTEEKLEIPIERMKQIGQILDQIHSKTRSQNLRVAIEQYKELLKIFEQLTQ